MYMKRRSGFTLIEVLLVIGILLVLGTVSVVAYTRIQASSNKKATTLLINDVVRAVELYQAQMNSVPDADQGLQALLQPPADDEAMAEKWRDGGGPFLENGAIPTDPWGNEIQYSPLESEDGLGPAFRVWSYGPDKQDNTDDDISNVKDEAAI